MKWYLIVFGTVSAVAGFFGFKIGKGLLEYKNDKLEAENYNLRKESKLIREAVRLTTENKEAKDFTPEIEKSESLDDIFDAMNEMIKDSRGAK